MHTIQRSLISRVTQNSGEKKSTVQPYPQPHGCIWSITTWSPRGSVLLLAWQSPSQAERITRSPNSDTSKVQIARDTIRGQEGWHSHITQRNASATTAPSAAESAAAAAEPVHRDVEQHPATVSKSLTVTAPGVASVCDPSAAPSGSPSRKRSSAAGKSGYEAYSGSSIPGGMGHIVSSAQPMWRKKLIVPSSPLNRL